MKLIQHILLVGLFTVANLNGVELFSPESEALSVPMRTDLTVDGQIEDWEGDVYTVVRLFADEVGRRSSIDANVWLAWAEEELYVAVSVVDDVIAEAPGFSLWQGDALVLHLADKDGNHPVLFMLTPGLDQQRNNIESRTLMNDHRPPDQKETPCNPKYATVATDVGYQMELAIPLSCFGGEKSGLGDIVSLQIEIKDRENDTENPGLQWNPELNAIRNPSALNKIRLTEYVDDRPQAVAMGRIVDEQRAEVVVYADKSLGGKPITVLFPDGVLANGSLPVVSDQFYTTEILERSFTVGSDTPRTGEVYLADRRVARIDFTKVPWVTSKEKFAPIPSLASMKLFEEDRSSSDYGEDAVLAIGSSSIRFWDTIVQDLAPWEIIKRGFGGSSMSDVVGAYEYLVEPYDVNRFIIYEGDTESGREMPEAFLRYARIFIERLAVDRPDAQIVFLTPKPSPKRLNLWSSTYRKANEGLNLIVAEYDNVHLIDVASPLFAEDGSLKTELFKDDGVHLNEAGYKVWTSVIRPGLESAFGIP